jgi:hypothetical protein
VCTQVYTVAVEYEKLVIYLRPEDKQNIIEKMKISCNGMSESELGRRAIFQYLDARMNLQDKKPGSFYIIYK